MISSRQSLSDIENDVAKIGTKYSVRNPHPGFGIDPHIKNEYGHTLYPKYIDHPWKKQVHSTVTNIGRDQTKTNIIETDIPERVLVNDEKEEKAVMGEKPPAKAEAKAEGWKK